MALNNHRKCLHLPCHRSCQELSQIAWRTIYPAVKYAETFIAASNVSYSRLTKANISHLIMTGKRRKIRCKLSTENVVVCVGCLNRGITCVVQQAQKWDDITSAHFDEKLGRIEAMLKRLVENGVFSAARSTPSATSVNQSSRSKIQATDIANSGSIGEKSPNDAFSNNVILSCHFCITSTNTCSQITMMESFNHVSKTTPQIACNHKSLRRFVKTSRTCFLRSMTRT
jgi:hypothetical protein